MADHGEGQGSFDSSVSSDSSLPSLDTLVSQVVHHPEFRAAVNSSIGTSSDPSDSVMSPSGAFSSLIWILALVFNWLKRTQPNNTKLKIRHKNLNQECKEVLLYVCIQMQFHLFLLTSP